MSKKYRLTDVTINCLGPVIYRIQALKDFNDVKKGDLGGYIQGYHNLSQEGSCWVYDDAIVRDNAGVYNNAIVRGNAIVQGNAFIGSSAIIKDYAEVSDKSLIKGHIVVCNNVRITGYPSLLGDIVIRNKTDYVVFRNIWSSGENFTYTFSNKMWSVGCFYGNSEKLIEKAYADSKLSGDMYSLYVELVEKMEKVRNEQEV